MRFRLQTFFAILLMSVAFCFGGCASFPTMPNDGTTVDIQGHYGFACLPHRPCGGWGDTYFATRAVPGGGGLLGNLGRPKPGETGVGPNMCFTQSQYGLSGTNCRNDGSPFHFDSQAICVNYITGVQCQRGIVYDN